MPFVIGNSRGFNGIIWINVGYRTTVRWYGGVWTWKIDPPSHDFFFGGWDMIIINQWMEWGTIIFVETQRIMTWYDMYWIYHVVHRRIFPDNLQQVWGSPMSIEGINWKDRWINSIQFMWSRVVVPMAWCILMPLVSSMQLWHVVTS